MGSWVDSGVVGDGVDGDGDSYSTWDVDVWREIDTSWTRHLVRVSLRMMDASGVGWLCHADQDSPYVPYRTLRLNCSAKIL